MPGTISHRPVAPRFWLWLLLAALLLQPAAIADDVTDLALGDPERRDRTVTVALDTLVDTRTSEALAPARLAERLADVDLLLIGEGHTDIESHRVQLRVLEELARSGRRVLLGLEMLPSARQEALDRWSAGTLSEEAFLEASDWYRHWGYPWGYYREILLLAREYRLPTFGVNVPRGVVSTVRQEGFAGLTDEDRALLPTQIDIDSADHRQLLRAFFTGDDGSHGELDDETFEGLVRAQCTWDAAMAWNAVEALRRHGGRRPLLVLLAGSGHVAYGLGVERQATRLFEGRVASLIPVPVADRETTVRASYANFLWGVPERDFELYPRLGLFLAGSLDETPTRILHVTDDSPAARAGAQTGDILLTLGDTPIDGRPALRRAMAAYRWGDVVPLRLRREEEVMTLDVAFRRIPEAEGGEEKENDSEEEGEEEGSPEG